MAAVLLDTHTWAWTLVDSGRLSATARHALETAEVVYVSPVSLFEIGQKVQVGKWPQMAPVVDELPDQLARQGVLSAPLDARICLRAGTMTWDHRDPFDRLLAATSLETDVPLVSADAAFDVLAASGALRARVW